MSRPYQQLEGNQGEWLQNLPREVVGGVLGTLIITVLNVVCASVVFHEGYIFSEKLGTGVTLSMLNTATGPILLLLLTDLPLICVSDTFMAALYAGTASSILARDVPNPLGTLLVAMFICSVINSSCYIALGVARVGKIVKFMPTPIMSGYLASTGYVQFHSSSTMVTGCGILQIECLSKSDKLPVLLGACLLGFALYVARKNTTGLTQTLLIPVVVVSVTLIFQMLRAFTDLELSKLMLVLPHGESALTLLDNIDLTQACSHPRASYAADATLSTVSPFTCRLALVPFR